MKKLGKIILVISIWAATGAGYMGIRQAIDLTSIEVTEQTVFAVSEDMSAGAESPHEAPISRSQKVDLMKDDALSLPEPIHQPVITEGVLVSLITTLGALGNTLILTLRKDKPKLLTE